MTLPTRIATFEIRGLLGEGGIGRVYAGFDPILGREVAVKSLRPELLGDPSFLERFRSEASSLAKLNHPNITTLYALVPEGQNLHMVMELVRGETLEALLARHGGRLDARAAIALVSQVGEGLAFAHAAGVIHRDIKPSNLMVTPEGVVKIMDFGIARVEGARRLTRTGSIVGTLAYMSPEQLKGAEGDERSDVYSLAIVLYEILTGAPPFKGDTDYALMQAQIKDAPARPSVAGAAGVGRELDAAILRALEKKPEKRFANVRAFLDAVAGTGGLPRAAEAQAEVCRLFGGGTGAPPVGAPPRPGLVARRGGVLSGPLLGVGIGVGAALVATAGVIFFLSHDTAGSGGERVATSDLVETPINGPLSSTEEAAPMAGRAQLEAIPTAGAPVVRSAADRQWRNDLFPGQQRRLLGEPAGGIAPPPAPDLARDGVDRMSAPASSGGAQPLGGREAEALAAPGADLVEAELAYSREDFRQALAIARPLAERGDAEAQFLIAKIYDFGRGGVEKDLAEAFKWYRRAGEQGHARAQFSVGRFYYSGFGVIPANAQTAAYWYQKAADAGDLNAAYNLARMYYQGDLGPADAEKAKGLFARVMNSSSRLSADAREAYNLISGSSGR